MLHRARPDHSESTAPGNRPMSDCYRHERTQTRHRAHRPSSPKATESPMVVATDNDAQQGVSQPLRLLVDSRVHAAELARFESLVVRGPQADDCAIWKGAIGGDGYRQSFGCIAAVARGSWCGPTGMRWPPPRTVSRWSRRCARCTSAVTTPVCVRVSRVGEMGLLHVLGGTQRDNMEMMGRAGRGGGRGRGRPRGPIRAWPRWWAVRLGRRSCWWDRDRRRPTDRWWSWWLLRVCWRELCWAQSQDRDRAARPRPCGGGLI